MLVHILLSTQVIGSKLTPEFASNDVAIHEWQHWVQKPNKDIE
jgi:hypothetical protein